MEDVRIIEINGVKLEVDMRHAKVIENYKVGDNIKLLKKSYGDSFNVHTAVIVGFDDFKNLPTIEILYIEGDEIQFIALNEKTQGIEIAPLSENERMFDKEMVLEKLERGVLHTEKELAQKKRKRDTFLEYYGKYIEKKELEMV